MTVQLFLDTNVLIYAAMGRTKEQAKWRKAVELLGTADFGTSTQVLQEFYVNLQKLTGPAFKPVRAVAWIERLERLPIVSITPSIVKAAIVHSTRWKISYWDAALIAAAEALGAETLCTEDLSHGQLYGSVRVENPFRGL
jgi:predicted nucleic acid-binding protein